MNRSTSLRMRSSNASWSSNACGMGDQYACKKIGWKNIAPTFKSCQAIGLPQTRDSGPVLHSQTAGRWAPRSSQLWSQSLRPDLCCMSCHVLSNSRIQAANLTYQNMAAVQQNDPLVVENMRAFKRRNVKVACVRCVLLVICRRDSS